MAIIVNLDVMLAKRKRRLNELSEYVGVSPQNLSILKTGKARAVRFSTLAAICQFLECQPGDILEFREEAVENTPRHVASDTPTPAHAEPINIPTMKTRTPPTTT
jgi:putative transcriptional regulator